MLRILIVEDDGQLASTLKYLIEDNPRYRVVGMAEDLEGAMGVMEASEPDLALVDLHLARGCTGFSVAVRLNDAGVPVLFVSGKSPGFPMPDLALGILLKPFTGEDVYRALAAAEDLMRGRENLRKRVPANLQLYENMDADPGAPEEPGLVPRPTLRARLQQWVAGTTH